jgi:hypothetical protein
MWSSSLVDAHVNDGRLRTGVSLNLFQGPTKKNPTIPVVSLSSKLADYVPQRRRVEFRGKGIFLSATNDNLSSLAVTGFLRSEIRSTLS